jgi:hypothetical protein
VVCGFQPTPARSQYQPPCRPDRRRTSGTGTVAPASWWTNRLIEKTRIDSVLERHGQRECCSERNSSWVFWFCRTESACRCTLQNKKLGRVERQQPTHGHLLPACGQPICSASSANWRSASPACSSQRSDLATGAIEQWLVQRPETRDRRGAAIRGGAHFSPEAGRKCGDSHSSDTPASSSHRPATIADPQALHFGAPAQSIDPNRRLLRLPL